MKNTEVAFKELSETDQDNLNVVLDYMNDNKLNFKDVSEKLKDNTVVAMNALKVDPKNIEFLSERLKSNVGVISVALEQDGTLLQYTANSIKNNEKVLYVALKDKNGGLKSNQSDIVKHASPELQAKILDLTVVGFVETIKAEENFGFNTKVLSSRISDLRKKFFGNASDISNGLKVS